MQALEIAKDTSSSSADRLLEIFTALDINTGMLRGGKLKVISPIDGVQIASVQEDSAEAVSTKIPARHSCVGERFRLQSEVS